VTSVAAHASNTPPRSITSGAIAPCRALRFDESGDGLIQFNELNTQLRQSVAVDAAVLGNNVRGEAAAHSRWATTLAELEAYRVFDVGSGTYFHEQTRGVPAGSLVFVRQGAAGAVSMVLAGGRPKGTEDAALEITLLVRACF